MSLTLALGFHPIELFISCSDLCIDACQLDLLILNLFLLLQDLVVLLSDLVPDRVDLHDDLLMLSGGFFAFSGERRALLPSRTDIGSHFLKLVDKVNDFGIFSLLGN